MEKQIFDGTYQSLYTICIPLYTVYVLLILWSIMPMSFPPFSIKTPECFSVSVSSINSMRKKCVAFVSKRNCFSSQTLNKNCFPWQKSLQFIAHTTHIDIRHTLQRNISYKANQPAVDSIHPQNLISYTDSWHSFEMINCTNHEI